VQHLKLEIPEGSSFVSRITTPILFRIINYLDEKNSTITTYRIKPLKTSFRRIQRHESLIPKFKKTGIVIQGPIVEKITVKICERYRELYPETRIVLSTWQNQNSLDLARIRKMGIHVLENVIPQNAGPANVNLQIKSTKSGIDYCKSLKCEYVLKNRSDVMLSSDSFLENFYTLISTFTKSNSKIVIPSYNSFLFRLYSPSDQIQFGKLNDLEQFWNSPMVEKDTQDFRFAESYLVRGYLSRSNRVMKNDIMDSLLVLRDYFIVADNEKLGLVFNKGTKIDVSNRWGKRDFPEVDSQISFWIWLDLESNLETYVDYYEQIQSITELQSNPGLQESIIAEGKETEPKR
jgi:hypothetical protein